MKTTLLLDADIIAYKVAARNQKDYDWGDTGSSRALDHDKALKDTDEIVAGYCTTLKTQAVVVCLTDPDRNFRKELDPTYKAARKVIEKPELLQWVKDYLYRDYRSFVRPRLEADDVMGILATHPTILEGKKIIVSEDKDMRTIPGYVYNPNHPELGVLHISRLDADRFHMWQTITGDTTDGYPGVKGVGPKSPYAEEIIGADRSELWDIVLEAYGSKGQGETEAILQARMAYILRSQGFNLKTRKVKLWQPEWLL